MQNIIILIFSPRFTVRRNLTFNNHVLHVTGNDLKYFAINRSVLLILIKSVPH